MSALKWTGEGWLVGVPARDLTEEEAKQHKDAIKTNEEATGKPLYVPVDKKKEKA